jgi:hypothetical protein
MITIVSGLPRSGTSLMMQILAASGYEILTDGLRQADENNLNGYFEYEKVKSLKTDNSWITEAEGKVVKIVVQLLPYIPEGFQYEIFFMERNLDEVLRSQSRMLGRMHKNVNPDNKTLKIVFEKQTGQILKHMGARKDVKLHTVSFNKLVIADEDEINALIEFTQHRIAKEILLSSIHLDLYRERI